MNYRRKYYKAYCDRCGDFKKMVLEETDNDSEVLHVRCDHCRSVLQFPFERVVKSGRILTQEEYGDRKEAMAEIQDYDPKQSYWRGQTIRHPKLKDIGKVVDKKETQGNHKIIVVEFEKNGMKQLVEEIA